MVEVFKTNVQCAEKAKQLIDEIHRLFKDCKANFDLEDCDRILRIKSTTTVETVVLIELMEAFGFEAKILEDEPVPDTSNYFKNNKKR